VEVPGLLSNGQLLRCFLLLGVADVVIGRSTRWLWRDAQTKLKKHPILGSKVIKGTDVQSRIQT
jgi:hypothetical protein